MENDLPVDGIHVAADFDQLVQVFRNLLENAIRHSPPDEVINVSRQDRGSIAAFSVRDNGPGIPTQHQHRIFERFYRIEKHRGDHGGSTGLGLAICRHIVRNHGGRIWVRSSNEEKYRLPFEPIGELVYPFVDRQLRYIFRFREAAIRSALLTG